VYSHLSRIQNKQSDVRNPAFECPFDPTLLNNKEVLGLGLVTANIIDTSPALRYLACKGQTAPLDAQNGVAFEIILQHHLVRLCRAKYEYETRGDNSSYFGDQYDLVQAWPPSSMKKNDIDVAEEVMTRYKHEEKKNRGKKDVAEIAALLKNKEQYDLVLRQTVGNVQGADVLVLSKKAKENEATLDLYQAKHYNKVPSCNSGTIIRAFACLGIEYNPERKSFNTQPTTGSAGYSHKGTEKFVEDLSKALDGIKITVRDRVVVFSQDWESFSKTNWNTFDFELAKEKHHVWIWTSDMLQPTISALVPVPALDTEENNASNG
jgi:hypothetical protein